MFAGRSPVSGHFFSTHIKLSLDGQQSFSRLATTERWFRPPAKNVAARRSEETCSFPSERLIKLTAWNHFDLIAFKKGYYEMYYLVNQGYSSLRPVVTFHSKAVAIQVSFILAFGWSKAVRQTFSCKSELHDRIISTFSSSKALLWALLTASISGHWTAEKVSVSSGCVYVYWHTFRPKWENGSGQRESSWGKDRGEMNHNWRPSEKK